MAEKKEKKQGRPGWKRRILRMAGIALVLIVIVAVAAWFYLTSGHFIRTFVLPRAGEMTGTRIEAGKISISPLSRIVIGNLRVMPEGQKNAAPLFQSELFDMKYHAFSFLKMAPKVDHVRITKPEIRIVRHNDGSTNLDPILKKLNALAKPETKKKEDKESPGTIPDFFVGEISVKDASAVVVEMDESGREISSTALNNISVELNNLKPDAEALLKVAMTASMNQPAFEARLENAEISSETRFTISRLMSQFLVQSDFEVTSVKGRLKGHPLEGLRIRGNLDAENSGSRLEIKPSGAEVFLGEAGLAAAVHLNGDINIEKGEGVVALKAESIDRDLLNLFGALAGPMDFRDTTVIYEGKATLSSGFQSLQYTGDLTVADFSVAMPGVLSQPIEPMEITSRHELAFDAGTGILTVGRLDFTALQRERRTGAFMKGRADLKAGTADFSIEEFSADLLMANSFFPPDTVSLESGKIRGKAKIAVREQFGHFSLNAEGGVENLKGRAMNTAIPDIGMDSILEVDAAKAGAVLLKKLTADISAGGKPAGRISISGDISSETGRGEVSLNVSGIDRNVLNLAGALAGNLDFQQTAISYEAKASLDSGFQAVTYSGKLDVSQFSILAPDVSPVATDPMNVSSRHEMSFDAAARKLTISRMDFAASQGSREAVRGTLDKPMIMDFSSVNEQSGETPPVALTFKVTDLDLAPLLLPLPLPEGTRLEHGRANADVRLLVEGNGRKISLAWDKRLEGLSGRINNQALPGTDISTSGSLDIADFQIIHLAESSIVMKQNTHECKAVFHADADIKAGTAELVLDDMAADPLIANPFLPSDMLSFESGTIRGKAKISASGQFGKFIISATGRVDGLKGRAAEARIPNVGVSAVLDVEAAKTGSITISKMSADITAEGKPAGTATLTGALDAAAGTGHFDFALNGLNQELLTPLVEPYLPEAKLKTIEISARQQATLSNAFRNISLEGSAGAKQISLVSAKNAEALLPPYDIGTEIVLKWSEPKLTIEKAALIMHSANAPEERVTLSGDISMNMAKPDIIADLALKSDLLTLDRYIPPAFLAEGGKDEEKVETPPQPLVDPELLALDFIHLKALADLKEIKFQDVRVTGVIVKAAMEKSRLDIPEITWNLNSTPGMAAVYADFSKPGWGYGFEASTKGLDLAPLIAAFRPSLKDSLSGTADFSTRIDGVGITPESLDRNLKGEIHADLKDGHFKGLILLKVLADILRISELNDIRFFVCHADLKIGDGKIVVNELFTRGTQHRLGIRKNSWIALNREIDLRFDVAVSQDIGNRLDSSNYLGKIPTTEDGFTKIPVIVGMKGTLASPLPSLDSSITDGVKDAGKAVMDTLGTTGSEVKSGLKDLKKDLLGP